MKVNDNAIYLLIGARIRMRRRELGITQAKLADTTGELRTSISNIESGRQKAPLDVMFHICEALEIEPKDVIPSLAEVSLDEMIRHAPPKTAALVRELMQGAEPGERQET